MNEDTHFKLADCLQTTEIKTNTTHSRCEKLVVHDLIPKFLILHLKSTETEVKSELMIHKPCKYIIYMIIMINRIKYKIS